jgi:hypothetical protein
MSEKSASAVCVLCDWAYGQGDSERPGEEYSLEEAQRNFATYLTFRGVKDLASFVLETQPDVVAAKEKAIAALEQWRAEMGPSGREEQF